MKPGERLDIWRANHWPPKGLNQYRDLPIYIGGHESVTQWTHTLAEALMVAADHIYEHCRGRTPRWMRIPKIHFGVQRLNVVVCQAKASKRLTSVEDLLRQCGSFAPQDTERMKAFLQESRAHVLVAHKPFTDIRAYVFSQQQEAPERVRFYESGLVIAANEHFVVQDHRTTLRRQRKDALAFPLASNSAGWTVFPKDLSQPTPTPTPVDDADGDVVGEGEG
jgi:hypothetical protein